MLARHNSVWLVPPHGATETVAAVGTLDRTTYPALRDGLLAFAADGLDELLVDIERLALRDHSLVTVFSLVALRVEEWPAVPFALVTGRPEQRAVLAASPAGRRVPVYADVATAERAFDHPARLRACRVLDRSSRTSAQARDFVRGTCAEWRVAGLTEDAVLVATEFVENTLRHTVSAPRLRLELRRRALAVEVTDESAAPAVVREGLDRVRTGLGLRLVAGVAKTWGSSPSRGGGKTVWALLPRA
ncbi:ATP-binding protein [Amycolatopsis stemonae]